MQNLTNEEKTNEVNTQTQNPAQEQRTFTQADVDRIVGERLTREREKYEADARKREALATSRESWTNAGYPAEAFDRLELDENGRVHLDKVLEFAGSLQAQIDTLKKAQTEQINKPRFGGSVKGNLPQIDRLAEAFKAPH